MNIVTLYSAAAVTKRTALNLNLKENGFKFRSKNNSSKNPLFITNELVCGRELGRGIKPTPTYEILK